MSKPIFVKRRFSVLVTLALGSMGLTVSGQAAAVQQLLSFSSYSQVYGYASAQVNSPLLGTVNVQASGPYDYRGTNDTGPATSTWAIPMGQSGGGGGGGGGDLAYDIITNYGQYGYGYDGQAQALGNQLKTKISTSSTDIDSLNPNPSYTSIWAYAQASYSDQWLITALSSKGRKYGAIVVTAQLDGTMPALPSGQTNSASAYLSANSSFTDISGVNYNSSFSINAYNGGYSVPGSNASYDWSVPGTVTIQKKLLFQYGTPFNLGMTLQAYSSANGEADFFNTAKITEVEIPFDTELSTGSSGFTGFTLGNLRSASTLDDPNTNWDFGNGGGGIIPGIPEPETYALMLAGLGLIGAVARRRKQKQDRA